jgi:hypothetical protein
MTEEKFGVETLKRLGTATVKLGTDVSKAVDKDGPGGKKITLPESFQIGGDIIGSADLFSSGKQIEDEINDLSEEESADVIAFIAAQLSISNEVAKDRLVKGLKFISSGYIFFESFKKAA